MMSTNHSSHSVRGQEIQVRPDNREDESVGKPAQYTSYNADPVHLQ